MAYDKVWRTTETHCDVRHAHGQMWNLGDLKAKSGIALGEDNFSFARFGDDDGDNDDPPPASIDRFRA